MNPATPLLELKDLRVAPVTEDGVVGKDIVKGISLTIRPGETRELRLSTALPPNVPRGRTRVVLVFVHFFTAYGTGLTRHRSGQGCPEVRVMPVIGSGGTQGEPHDAPSKCR